MSSPDSRKDQGRRIANDEPFGAGIDKRTTPGSGCIGQPRKNDTCRHGPVQSCKYVIVCGSVVSIQYNTETKVTLQGRLRRDSSLRQLAATPLMLRFLCQLADPRSGLTELPNTRAGVLEKLVFAILGGSFRSSPARSAIHPYRQPEPGLRLAVLSQAVGKASRGWRTGSLHMERIVLEDGLRKESRYK